MDEMQQITLDQWMSWKEDIREKLRETAGNFVYIGFRLKQIRDSGMFDGAADIFEFAEKEYGLSKSTTSRFIAINEKFSEGGNSMELREEFRTIGSSKLAEMLTLPDAECQMITERTTVREIRELKNFGKQEVPEVTGEEEEQLTPLEKCLVDYFKDKKDMLNEVMKNVYDDRYEDAAEQMNPSGYATHKKGICFMFMYDFNTGVKLKLLTEPQPVTLTWKELLLDVYEIYANTFEAGEEDVHKAYYGEQGKEGKNDTKTENQKVEETQKNQGVAGSVATSQQQKKETSAEAQEQADIIPKTEQNVPELIPMGTASLADIVKGNVPKPTEEEIAEAVAKMEKEENGEQLPGQMEVGDFPEVLPEQEERDERRQGEDDNTTGTSECIPGDRKECGTDRDATEDHERKIQEDTEDGEPKTQKSYEESGQKESRDYQKLKEDTEELAHGVYDVFWGWSEESVIPKGELAKALENAKKLVGMIEQLMEMTEEE